MKALKKLSCVLLAVLLLMSLSVTAFAAESGTYPDMPTDSPVPEGTDSRTSGTYSITINQSAEGHEFKAYQIFSGDLYGRTNESGGADEVLSNIKWGADITIDSQNALISHYETALRQLFTDQKRGEYSAAAVTAADVAAVIGNDARAADDLASFLAANKGTYLQNFKALEYNRENKNYSVSGLAAGYYMVIDALGATASLEDSEVSDYIVQVVDNVSMQPKADVPKVEKKIVEGEDHLVDSTFAGLNDDVKYQIKATLPSNYTEYKSYFFKVTDNYSEGLTPDTQSIKVWVGENEITNYFSIDLNNDTRTITVTPNAKDTENNPVNDLKLLNCASQFGNNVDIFVTYTATVNSEAVIGNPGNPNTVKLSYNNDPNYDGKGQREPGHTPPDTVVVFTFEVDVNKVENDPDNPGKTKPLKGAGFTLFVKDDTAAGGWSEIRKEVVGGDTTTFKFERLDVGFYKLEETTTPAGYNTVDPIYFKVVGQALAEKDGKTYDPPIAVLTVTQTYENGDEYTGAEAFKFTFTTDNTEVKDGVLTGGGTAVSDVVNKQGLVLPETGGIGTTIFYVVGGLLIAAAAVLLITKKRMTKEG